MKNLKERAIVWLFTKGLTLIRILPYTFDPIIVRIAAFVKFHFFKKRVEMVIRHQKRITGITDRRILSELAYWTFEKDAQYWVDFARAITDKNINFKNVLEFEDAEKRKDLIEGPEGVILVLAHSGNWEIAGAYLAANGVNLMAVQEDIKPAELSDWFKSVRSRLGIKTVLLGENAEPDIISHLRSGGRLALLCDRHVSEKVASVKVKFFGECFDFPAGPALLSIRTKCPIVVAGVYTKLGRMPDGGYFVKLGEKLYPPVEGRLQERIQILSEIVAKQLEDVIKDDPTDWHCLTPNWASDFSIKF